MRRLLRASSAFRASLAWRAAWASLAALHFAPIVRLGSDLLTGAGGAGSLALLAIAFAFFALKAMDVRWLRLPGRHGSLIALLLLALVGHGDVVVKGLEQMPMLAPAVTLVLGAAAARSIARRGRLLPRGMSEPRIADPLRLRLNRLATGLLWLLIAHRRTVASVPCFAGRSPPL